MRAALIALVLALPAVVGAAPTRPRPPPKKPPPSAPDPRPPEQVEADRHFKAGVALFKDARYTDALAEFQRAYAIAPHPLVLYNIASCHRELSHYSEAVTFYGRFLVDGAGKVPQARLDAAKAELDAILALVARVTVVVAPPEATLTVDDAPLDHPAMPLILMPGEHRVVARAPGRRDAERSLRAIAGDVVTVEIALAEPTEPTAPTPAITAPVEPARPLAAARRFAVGAGFGTNLRLARDTGAPSVGVGAALGERIDLGVDVVLVAYAVIPSIRVRLLGDALALHAVGAVPIAFTDDPMRETFVAGALGLGVRYRATPGLALRLESYVSFAGKAHGTTIPTFLGGELWF